MGESERTNHNDNFNQAYSIRSPHEISGIEVKEQAGHGIVDIRLICSSEPRTYSDWATNNPNGTVRSTFLGSDQVVIGLKGEEQAGFGIVDIHVLYRNRNGGNETITSTRLTQNQNGKENHSIWASRGKGNPINGMIVYEQHGFGIVNFRVLD